jgi:tetratricopeptide (TPR) repeat protein
MKRKDSEISAIGDIHAGSDKRPVTIGVVMLLMLVLGAYANSFTASWHMDDFTNILNNPAVQMSELYVASLLKAISIDQAQGNNLSRPLANLSFALNWYWNGDNVAGFHLVNLMIHVSNAVLLYGLILLLGATPGFPVRYRGCLHVIALGTSMLWALNPIQTQAVTYVIQRMTSLATLFYLVTMGAYLKCRLSSERRSQVMWGTVVAAAFLLAMGAKENAATLPMALVLIEMVFFPAEDGKIFGRKVGILLSAGLGIMLLVVTMFFLWSDRNIVHLLSRSFEMRPFTLVERALTQPRVLVFYLSLLLYPIPQRLSLEHDIPVSTSLWHPWSTLPAIIFIAFLIIFGVLQMRKRPLVSFATLFFFLNHAVESTILPLEMVFEHRNYLPSAFLFLPIATLWFDLRNAFQTKSASWRLLGTGAAVSIILFLGSGTFIRNLVWQTEQSLWTDAQRKAPGRARPVFNLAKEFERRGDLEQAMLLYQKSMLLQSPRLNQFDIMALTNIGTIFYKSGQNDKAISYYRKALELLPEKPKSRYNLALAYTKDGQFEQAEMHLKWLLEEIPAHEPALDLMGLILLKQNRFEESLSFSQRLLRLKPNHRSPNLQIGMAYTHLNMMAKGEWFLNRAHRIDPENLVVLLCMLDNQLASGDSDNAKLIGTTIIDRFTVDSIRKALTTDLNEVGHPNTLAGYLESSVRAMKFSLKNQ